MKQLLLICFSLLLVAACLVAPVSAAEFWIYGSVDSVKEEKEYNGLYYQFEMVVSNSSNSDLTVPSSLTCVIPMSSVGGSTLKLGDVYNFTGTTITDQPTETSIPVGYFLITAINVPPQPPDAPWLETLKAVLAGVASVGRNLVVLVVQGLGAAFGVTVPSWIVNVVVVLMIAYVFVKWGKKLPWILIIIAFLLMLFLAADLLAGFAGLHL